MQHLPAPSVVRSRLLPDSPIEPCDDERGTPSHLHTRRPRLGTPASKNEGSAAGTGERVRRILWIDDEFDFDNPLVRLLAFEGFRTEVEASGAEGLVKAQAGSYDGIVLDLRLPDIFGLSVLTRLVAHDDAQPVLVVTGYYHEP